MTTASISNPQDVQQGVPNLNSGLHALHTFFVWLYGLVGAVMTFLVMHEAFSPSEQQSSDMFPLLFGLLIIGVYGGIGYLHWYAAKGARLGRNGGKIASRILGSILLLGIPIGTILGIYMLYRTSSRNWESGGHPIEAVPVS